jgi:phage-related protein
MPQSRPMPSIGRRCHELRIRDPNRIWRVVHRLNPDVIVIASVFPKTTAVTSAQDITKCKRRMSLYDADLKKERKTPEP